ncbi:MAG TPA: hypothetical protein VJY85_00800 [Candidatus Limnocylindria bacterium]|nr:hypothetical protein [Candidatus Limnocylindria bacterium]
MASTHGTGAPHRIRRASYADRRPLSWTRGVAEQISAEAGLALTADIEDLVILTYVGLLDSPDPHDLSQERLRQRSRQGLITWAWEQGVHQEAMPTLVPHRPS